MTDFYRHAPKLSTGLAQETLKGAVILAITRKSARVLEELILMRLTRLIGAALASALVLVPVLVAQPSQAIVGGSNVPNGAYSFMASVQDGGFHFCGGSVISSTYVLTAAHCVPDGNAAGLTVRVGSNDNTTGGFVIPVAEVIVDPAYDGTYFDAALLRLQSAVPGTVGPAPSVRRTGSRRASR